LAGKGWSISEHLKRLSFLMVHIPTDIFRERRFCQNNNMILGGSVLYGIFRESNP
jgi:hypothetical protein